MNFDNLPYDIVGMKLANGQVQVVKGTQGVNEVFANEQAFMSRYQQINEATGKKPTIICLDTING